MVTTDIMFIIVILIKYFKTVNRFEKQLDI
jgi:hypothetical protein